MRGVSGHGLHDVSQGYPPLVAWRGRRVSGRVVRRSTIRYTAGDWPFAPQGEIVVRHSLVVHVTVVEQDEHGNIVARLCEPSERGPLPDVPADAEQQRQDYCQWAYRGFNLIRNGPLGLVEPDPGVPRLGLLVLRTSQVEAVRAFYAALGVSFTEERHGEGPRHYTCRLGPLFTPSNPATEARPIPRPDWDSELMTWPGQSMPSRPSGRW